MINDNNRATLRVMTTIVFFFMSAYYLVFFALIGLAFFDYVYYNEKSNQNSKGSRRAAALPVT